MSLWGSAGNIIWEATECITKDAVLQGTENVLEIIPLGLINMLFNCLILLAI